MDSCFVNSSSIYGFIKFLINSSFVRTIKAYIGQALILQNIEAITLFRIKTKHLSINKA